MQSSSSSLTAPAETREKTTSEENTASPPSRTDNQRSELDPNLPFGSDWGLAEVASLKGRPAVLDLLNALVGGKPKLYSQANRTALNQLVVDTRKARHNHASASANQPRDEADSEEGSANSDSGAALTGAPLRVGGDDRMRLLGCVFHENNRDNLLDLETQASRHQLDERVTGGSRHAFFTNGAELFNSDLKMGWLVVDTDKVLTEKGFDPDRPIVDGHNTLTAVKFKQVYSQLRKAYTETHRKFDQSGNGRRFNDFCNTQQYASEVLYLHRLLEANGSLSGFFAVEVEGGFNGDTSSASGATILGKRTHGEAIELSSDDDDSSYKGYDSADSNHRGRHSWLRDALNPGQTAKDSSSAVDAADAARIGDEAAAIRQRSAIEKDQYLSAQLMTVYEKLEGLGEDPKNSGLRAFLNSRVAVLNKALEESGRSL